MHYLGQFEKNHRPSVRELYQAFTPTVTDKRTSAQADREAAARVAEDFRRRAEMAKRARARYRSLPGRGGQSGNN